MDKTTIPFISYNPTGINKTKIEWINKLTSTFSVDFVQLQEHFKDFKTVDRFFKKEFPSLDTYVIAEHRDGKEKSGRAKDGLLQL